MMSAAASSSDVPAQDAVDGSGVLAAVGGQIAAAEEGGDAGAGPATSSASSRPVSNFMSMDVHAIRNLEIFENTYDQGKQGTLCSFLNHCATPAGRRLFRRWLAEPLCRPIAIHRRLDAVEDLMAIGDIRDEMRADLSRLPDLERLESSIHSMGSKYLASEHEMHKAVMYEAARYRARKAEELNAALTGFERANEIVLDFREQIVNGGITLKSDTLRMLLDVSAEGASAGGGSSSSSSSSSSSASSSKNSGGAAASGSWPDLSGIIEGLRIVAPKPRAGIDGKTRKPHAMVIQLGNAADPELDLLRARAKAIESEVHNFVKEAKRQLGERSLVVWGKGKNRWQIECPDKLSVPSSWKYNSKKKGKKRYYPARIARLKDEDDKLAEKIEEVEQDRFRKVFRQFSRHHQTWKRAVRALSRLDALMSLSVASDIITEGADGVSDQPVCRPEFVEDGTQVLELRNARHPCIAQTFSGNGFIPNDTILGGGGAEEGEACTSNASANCLLLTGPNMGGKSTVLRQTCVCVIMAQLGCYVPATKCRLSPVDRIFTRIGASDNILEGQSTFFVELSETSTILHEATPSSLVILDELGRGTSTFDGVAIAHSVVQKLAEDLGCRTMFATHYHSLVDEFGAHPNVALANMACKVMDKAEDDALREAKAADGVGSANDAGPDANVMFLYKLVGGACTKSYGLNVARLARLPEPVLAKANAKSKEFESTMVAAARESLASAIVRVAKEIEDAGACTPVLYKKLATLWGQARTVTGNDKK
jgi:DNA mismatch repair protein MSH6